MTAGRRNIMPSTHANKEQIKAQRRQAVSPADCGTTWHSAELNEIDILTGLMQQ